MSIDKAVDSAWRKVVQDFNKSCEEGTAVYWNEEILRLYFFRYLLQQDINVVWFLAEHEIYIEGKPYKPDLIIAFRINDEIKICVFEFKFWGPLREWKETWNKLLAYRKTLWFDRAYFIAIGPTGRMKELVETEEVKEWLKSMIYEKTWKEAFFVQDPYFLARDMLKRTLNMPFHELRGLGFIVVSGRGYSICFDAVRPDDKVLIVLVFPGLISGSKRWKELKEKLTVAGFDRYVALNENLIFEPVDEFKNAVLIDEFDDTFPETVKRIKERFRQLKPILADLRIYPT